MADVIDYQIYGNDMQLVEIELDPGEGVRAEVGTMTYMESGIMMQTNTGGGLFSGFKRMLTGEGFFITTFANSGAKKSRVGFAAPYPGQIIPLDLGKIGGEFLCQKDSFLCAAKGIDIDIAFTKRIGAGFFGGEGFILQKLTGNGLAFVHAGGAIIEKNLMPGETVRVDTGCIVAFSPSINYEIQFVGGFRNALFGGEGLFLANLTGPGKIYLQSMPFSKLADRILAHLPQIPSNNG
ncbi:MAG: TIGR00266 family protein [Oscillatoria sp. PMC 1068.18]|nr:TIGR00266 family protein [Oscillatoria sp. PMC 1076.18]MEC4987983.1 TIGR00266 family protein [Oscillatoria sp. PMC 1068.18]